jgi:riboflavin kinase/FMN adenylyltransferase
MALARAAKKNAFDVATLRALAGGAEVVVVEPTEVALTDASRVIAGSSLVRWLLGHGRVRDAALALGRPYTLVGEVVHGAKRGRQLGFPTANVAVDGQMVPADGVYAARCMGHAAAVSIGITPTFENRGRLVEAHLLDFAGDLYGQTLAVELIDWLRPQQKYPGVKALKLQLEKDVARTRAVAGQDPTEPIYRVA